jgi:hypothetical protein
VFNLDGTKLAALIAATTPTHAELFVVIFENLPRALALTPVVIDLHRVPAITQRVDPRMKCWRDSHGVNLPGVTSGIGPLTHIAAGEELHG